MLVFTVSLAVTGAMTTIEQPPSTSHFEEAIAARRAGRPDQAARLLERWLNQRPDDIDGRLHLGLAYRDLGRIGEAEQAFRKVLAQAPGYHDARIALAAMAIGRDDPAEARSLLRVVPSGNRDGDAVRKQLALAAASHWQFETVASVTAVGRNQPDWREWSGQLRGPLTQRLTIAGRIEASRRFDREDVFGKVTVDARLSRAVTAYLSAGGTPRADYRPIRQIEGGISSRIRSGLHPTILTLDVRRSRYRSGDVTLVQPGAQQYILGGKGWVSLQMVTLVERGQIRAGVLGRIDLEPGQGWRVFAGASRTPDTSEGIVTRVSSVFSGVEATLPKRRIVRLSLSRTTQKTGADRTELAVGLGTRF